MTGGDEETPVYARIRGIYSTALTRRFREAGHTVVQPSAPIAERFDDLPDDPATVDLADTTRRQGLRVSGQPAAVEDAVETLREVGIDTLDWEATAPIDAVYDAVVTEPLGSGAVVDLGDAGEGFLPDDSVDRRIDAGDACRVQVVEPAPPWTDRRPEVGTDLRVAGSLAALERGHDAAVVDGPGGDAGRELAGLIELLDVDLPDRWAVRWADEAADADLGTLGDVLGRLARRAGAIDEALDEAPAPGDRDEPDTIATPSATRFVWFGRESRVALDADRAAVVTTMPGHHRVKAGDRRASDAVDFAEAVFEPAPDDGAFPFGAVADQFGPREGDSLLLAHGKPAGHLITLGRASVTDVDGAAGRVTVRRELSAGGTLDALGVPIESGDVAVTTLTEGKWWYPTVYRDADGERKGTYVNVCTPVEVFPDRARYVDLHVDVVKHADGTVERVDDDELDAAVAAGEVPDALAEKAREVASSLEDAV